MARIKRPAAKLDLNLATREELMKVAELDQTQADAILERRTAQGSITTASDLDGLSGMTPEVLARLEPLMQAAAQAADEVAVTGEAVARQATEGLDKATEKFAKTAAEHADKPGGDLSEFWSKQIAANIGYGAALMSCRHPLELWRLNANYLSESFDRMRLLSQTVLPTGVVPTAA